MKTGSFAFAPGRASRLMVSTALALGVLTGCGVAGVRPDKLATSAQAALSKGSAAAAVSHAEKAVLADPLNPAYRVLLGNAYLKAGRFESARQAYDEAMELGEDSHRTALSLALADIALGYHAEAVDTLESYRNSIGASDYGLALALAGQTEKGIAVLTRALRDGENTPKVRQNLALAYALSGRWREARTMASYDVPANELGDRMQQWAMMSDPERTRGRVAALLDVPLRADAGQPAALALANFPATRALAAEAAVRAEPAAALAEQAVGELPAVAAQPVPEPALDDSSSQSRQTQLALLDLPPSRPQMPAAGAVRFESVPVVQPLRGASQPLAQPAAKPVAGFAPAVAARNGGSHLIQLGSFATEEGASRAWRHYTSRNPALKGFANVTTRVVVDGRTYWRVQAAGFGGFASASDMCGKVKARGGSCLVMRGSSPAQPAAGETRFAKR